MATKNRSNTPPKKSTPTRKPVVTRPVQGQQREPVGTQSYGRTDAAAKRAKFNMDQQVKFERQRQALREKQAALRKQLADATERDRKARLQAQLDKTNARIKDFAARNADRRNKQLEATARVQVNAEKVQAAQREAALRPADRTPKEEAARLERLGFKGASAYESSTTGLPYDSYMGGEKGWAGPQYADRFSAEMTNPNDARLMILDPQTGNVTRKKPTQREWNILMQQGNKSGQQAVARDKNGHPVVGGDSGSSGWSMNLAETDPEWARKHPRMAQNGVVVQVVGTVGPYLLSHEGQTVSSSEFGVTGTGPRNRKDSATTVVTKGTYATYRQAMHDYGRQAKTDPDAFAAFQKQLSDAGYIEKLDGHDAYVPGKMDRNTRNGIHAALKDLSWQGPQFGTDMQEMLALEKQARMVEAAAAAGSGGGGGGGGGGANAYPVSDPALLNMYAEEAAKAVLGRMPTPDEKLAAVTQIQEAERIKGNTQSGAIQDVDPQSAMTEFFRKKAPAESGAKNIADAFDAFVNILGPGGAAGKSSPVIDQGNSRVGP